MERLLAQVANKEATDGDECKVTGNFGRVLKPVCPMSMCPIEEAAIGKNCIHVQVFDLQSYIAVNQRMRSLDKRWTCPCCSESLRPDDIILEPFAQGILDTLRGDEDNVDAIVFNEDCTWSTVSAEKAAKDRQGLSADGATADGSDPNAGTTSAPVVDLSDSE